VTFTLKSDQPTGPKMLPTELRAGQEVPGMWDGIRAAFSAEQIETDAWFRTKRLRRQVEDRAIAAAREASPTFDDDVLAGLTDSQKFYTGLDKELRRRRELDHARTLGLDVPATDEDIEVEVNRVLREEWDDAQKVLGTTGMVTEFVGRMAGAVWEPANLAMLPLGGGGTAARIIAREAALGGAIEGAMLPRQFDMADRLDIADPDPVMQVLLGATGAAAITGGAIGAMRGWAYLQARNRLPEVPAGFTEGQAEAVVDVAEDAFRTGADPMEAVREAVERLPVTPAATPLAPDPITTTRLDDGQARLDEVPPQEEPPAPVADSDTPAWVQREIDDAETQADALERGATKGRRYPVMTSLRRMGVKIDPDSPEGQELYSSLGGAREANRTMPGLFKRPRNASDRERGLDNLVASEMEEVYPGITGAAGLADDGIYLDPRGVLDVIRREAAGDRSWMFAVQQADELRRGVAGDPLELADVRTSAAVSVDLDAYKARFPDGWREAVRQDVQEAVYDLDPSLTPDDIRSIVADAQDNGGLTANLLQRHYEREMDWVRSVDARAEDDFRGYEPAGDSEAGGRARSEGRVADGEEAGGSAEGGTGRDGPDPEAATFAGTDRIQTGDAQRNAATIAARQQQSKIGRLDQTRVEDDEGGLFGGAQADMFADPLSRSARAFQDEALADLRAMDDFQIDVGGTKISARSLLDDVDADTDFAEIVNLCGAKT